MAQQITITPMSGRRREHEVVIEDMDTKERIVRVLPGDAADRVKALIKELGE